VERGDQHGVPERVQAAPELADGLARLEQGLGGHAPQGDHDLGLEHAQLVGQERGAGGQLVGLGVPI
jgi:hypothetical protein